jgi:hypothetical protein
VAKNQFVFKVLFSFLVIYISAFQLNAQSREQLRAEYEKGKIDGELDARSNFGWVAAGFFLPVGSSIATFIFKPDPPAAALLGKSRAYILGYTKAYRSKSAWKNLRNTCIGTCALGVVAGVAFVIYDATKADTKKGEEKGWCEDWVDRNCNKPYQDCSDSWDKCAGDINFCQGCMEGDHNCDACDSNGNCKSCGSKSIAWILNQFGM